MEKSRINPEKFHGGRTIGLCVKMGPAQIWWLENLIFHIYKWNNVILWA